MAARVFRTELELIDGLQLKDFSPSDRFAVVVWNDSRHSESKYAVRWWSDGKDTACKKGVAIPVFTISDLNPGCRYWIQVAIDRQKHPEVYSEPLYFLTAPAAVENVKYERASKSTYNICWDPVEGARKYIIRYRRIDEAYKICETKTTDFILCGLDQGYAYVCSVAAENDAGMGAFSMPAEFNTDLPGPDFIEHDVTYNENEAIAEICFTPSKCEHIVNYKVLLMNDDDEVVTEKTVQKPRATFKNLQLGACYTPVVVVETKNEIESNKAFGVSFWTKPQKVSSVRTNPETKTVEKVKWNSVQGAQSYLVEYGDVRQGMKLEETQDCEILLNDLPPEAKYRVNIIAKGKGGQGRRSDEVFFLTALAPPQCVHLIDISDEESYSFLAEWQPTEGAVEYNVDIVDIKKNQAKPRTAKTKNSCEFKGLSPCTEYKVKVQAIATSEIRNSTIVTSPSKWTGPPIIQDFHIYDDSLTSRLLTWAKIPDATYKVRIQKAGDPPQFKDVKTNEYHLSRLDYHSKYTVSVFVIINKVKGKESKRTEFETVLFHPTNVRAESDSTTSLAVQFDEPEIRANRYQIEIITIYDETIKTQIVTRQQAMMRIIVDGLQPGYSYRIAVRSLHDKEAKLNSKEVISEIVDTLMPAPQPQLKKISGNSVGIKWNSFTGAISYKVYWRQENQDWEKREEKGREAFLLDLQYGSKYEVKVAAVSSVGEGKESIVIQFNTVPACPQGLKVEYLSPSEVKIWCDRVQGAKSYVFTVCGKTYEDPQPIIFQKIDTEILEVHVSAKNCDNESSFQSQTIVFEQALLRLQRKFRKSAKNKFTYIPPDFQDLVTRDFACDFGTAKYEVSEGETHLILGKSSTGKTSACYHYLQSLPEDKLAIYLDYDEFKGMTQKIDIEGVLGKCMTDLKPNHALSVLAWMKSNSEKIVFVLDNFQLLMSFEGLMLQYSDKGDIQQVFYNLITTKREIFPKSQVFCTSHQDHLQPMVNPTSVLKIIGFGDKKIQKMISHIFGNENADVQLPTQLKYFCINPCYCNTILQFWKTEHKVNMKSYSSVLVELLSKSLERHPVAKKKEKLTKLANEVEEFESSIQRRKTNLKKPSSFRRAKQSSDTATVMSDVPSSIDIQFQRCFEGNSCESLHSSIVSALYFGYFCSQESLKLRLKEINLGNMANMWTMAIGLMSPGVSYFAENLFKPISKKPMDVSDKLKELKEFIKKNMRDILRQVSRNHQIVLDWFNIISETGDEEIIKASKLKHKIDNSMADDDITEVTKFLENLPAYFRPQVILVCAKDLKQRLAIDMAITKNPDIRSEIPDSYDKKKDVICIKSTENHSTEGFLKFGSLRRSSKKPNFSVSQSTTAFEGTIHHNTAQSSLRETTSNLESASINRPITSSKPFKVDSSGCEWEICGCKISIPPNALKSPEELTITFDYKVYNPVDESIQIAPILRCEPPTSFECPVTIRLSSWCRTKSERVMAHIMSQENAQQEKEIEVVPLHVADGFIEFKASHLGLFWVHISKLSLKDVEFCVETSLLCHPTEGKMSLMFYVSQAYSRQQGIYREIVSPLNSFITKSGKEVLASITVFEEMQNQLKIYPDSTEMFKVDEEFARNLSSRIVFNFDPPPKIHQVFTVNTKIGDDEKVLEIAWRAEDPLNIATISNGPEDRPV